ncbi:Hypothetical predicted protein [Paramuricea clavata]|uniref:Uncharacterized protein n=1 Tax=Paramuricea clavata TaxID=317549 RepID=A0A7D9EIB7_PARCT|nr:Hypothetical predicted protein [Paramuricea clavata]
MDDVKRAKITRPAQRAQATKTWNKAETLMNDEINETNIQRLQVVLQTFDTKIEQLKKLDENISCKIETEKELESEIVEADDYLSELMDKRYRIQFFTSANQATTASPNNTLSAAAAQNYSQGEQLASQGHTYSPQLNNSSAHRLPNLLTNTSRYKNLGGNFSNSKFKTPPNPSKPKACTFCNGSHKPNDCTVVSDPAARKQITFQANLCFNCLNNHRVSQCKSKNRCRQCHQKHHTSLCVGNKERPEQQKPDPNARQNIKDKDRNVQCMCTNGGDVAQTTNTSEQTSGNNTTSASSTAAEQLEAISTFTSEPTNNPTNAPEPRHGVAKIINLSAYSNLHKLVRVTAWVLRFVDNLKKRTHSGPLSVTELDSALMFWIVDCQSVVATTSFGICPTTDEPSDEKDQPSENPPQREKRSAAVAAKKKNEGWTSSLLCPPEDVVK